MNIRWSRLNPRRIPAREVSGQLLEMLNRDRLGKFLGIVGAVLTLLGLLGLIYVSVAFPENLAAAALPIVVSLVGLATLGVSAVRYRRHL